jgi:TolB-like protein
MESPGKFQLTKRKFLPSTGGRDIPKVFPMRIKKISWFSIFALFFYTIPAFAQSSVTLDTGLGNAARYFGERLVRGTKVVVLDFSAPTPRLAEYVMEELTGHFVNEGSLMVVDRKNLEILEQEMRFQLSGEVDDDTVLAIGKKLGAQTIISGSIEPLGNIFRLRIRAIAVETAAIQGISTANIQRDQTLSTLTAAPRTDPAPRQAPLSPAGKSTPESSGSSGGGGSSGRVILPDYLVSPPGDR